jgi:hypothetical protein
MILSRSRMQQPIVRRAPTELARAARRSRWHSSGANLAVADVRRFLGRQRVLVLERRDCGSPRLSLDSLGGSKQKLRKVTGHARLKNLGSKARPVVTTPNRAAMCRPGVGACETRGSWTSTSCFKIRWVRTFVGKWLQTGSTLAFVNVDLDPCSEKGTEPWRFFSKPTRRRRC